MEDLTSTVVEISIVHYSKGEALPGQLEGYHFLICALL